jgi:CubicO group peptidase (beta-lactamase class C family)
VDAYIEETMRRLPIPGLAVGIVKENRVLYVQGYGTANVDGDPVTPQTPFMLASVTKTFTALAVQQLVSAGQIDLDRPIQNDLPEFRLADETAASAITVRHLLDHTSGITTLAGNQPYLHSPTTRFTEALEQLTHYRPPYPPGQRYEYSNWNYVLLGEIISRASNQPYAEYVQEHVLEPLEMSHTTFADPHTLPGAATGNLIVFGASVPYDEPYPPVMLSAGYLTSTAEDMTHYLVAFFDRGTYHRNDILPNPQRGWYDTSWYWHKGTPADIASGFSGGHNSINTNIQLFPLHRLGVVVLMNTRLDQMIPGPTVNDIAFNIARLTIGASYEVPSNRVFYGGYLAVDIFLLLLMVTCLWQILHTKDWSPRYRKASTGKRLVLWSGIILQLLIATGVLLLPLAFDTRWNMLLFFRPDFSLPLLVLSASLGLLAIIRIIMIIHRKKIAPPSEGVLFSLPLDSGSGELPR